MEQGKVDGNGAPLTNNQNSEQLEQSRVYIKGFIKIGILMLITSIVTICFLFLGIMLK